jgi:acetyl esterase
MPNSELPAVEDCACSGFQSDLRLRVHRPPPRRAAPPVLLYLHGGRFIAGCCAEAEARARDIAARLDAVVVAPEYSLANERPFPAAAEDTYAALKWIEQHAAVGGWSSKRVAVIGEEAGGNLAAVAAMMARDRGGPQLAAQVLYSPMLDPTLSTQSMQSGGEASALCSQAYRAYLPACTDRTHPYAAPLLCSRLTHLPPALIFSAENDPLRDEAETYGVRLIASGVKTQVVRLQRPGWSEETWRELIAFLAPILNPLRPRAHT